MKKLILPGGSGFMGQYLARYFGERGYETVILSRQNKQESGIAYKKWDGKHLGDWVQELEGADAVLNLAGRTVNCRYTPENRRQILESRVDSTRILGQAIAACTRPPRLWLNAGSATIYEDTRGELPANDEYSTRIGSDFSPGVCKAWEAAFFEAPVQPSVRRLALRIAIVLGKGGGALEPLLGLARRFMGGRQGGGQQFFSWIHLEDFARIVEFLIAHQEIDGIINCAAPNPLTNKELMQKLRRTVGRSWGLPLAEWMLRLGAVFMGTEVELVLKSRKVVSSRLPQAGFQFLYPELETALKQILS